MRDKRSSILLWHAQQGYVLVMALVLIALAGSVLAIMAKRSVFDASDVLFAQAQLKERWAIYSLNKSILLQAGDVMQSFIEPPPDKAQSTSAQNPPRVVRFDIELGQITYQMTLADEQAKANVNQILKNKGNPTQTKQAIGRLVERAQLTDVPEIELKPYTWPNAPLIAKLHTLGQVFKEVLPDKLYSATASDEISGASGVGASGGGTSGVGASGVGTSGVGASGGGILDLLTCWGDGRLNFRTAPRAVMLAICEPTLGRGQIDKLIAARQSNPKISLNQVLASASIAKNRLRKARQLFTDTSTCYSLWIQRKTPRQTHYALTIVQQEKSPQSPTNTAQKSQQSGKLMLTRFQW